MGTRRQQQYDTLKTGLIAGVLLPLSVFLILYLLRYASMPLGTFLIRLRELKILVKLLSLCGFANLLVFLFFYRNKMDRAARGVVAATFLYAMLVLVSRLV